MPLADPAEPTLSEARRIREEIDVHVQDLLTEIAPSG